MKTLVYFGNENLQKGIWSVSYNGSRNATGQAVQSMPIARGTGSSVVNTRLTSKMIDITGKMKVKTAPDNIEELMTDFDKIFNVVGEQYLRLVPEYAVAIPTDSATDWAGSDDASSVAVDSTQFQTDSSSLGFDIDVSASGNDRATLTYSGSTQVDLSSHTDTGNFEFWVNIPDTYYVESVDFKIGNDSSNYYSANFTSDYQGTSIHNGANLFSVDWADGVSETGTVNDAEIDYCAITVNYSTGAVDIDDCYIDGIMWVNETRVRNFPSYRMGEIKREGNFYNNTFTGWGASFLNHKGYAISTHTKGLFNSSSMTATSETQVIDLNGSMSLLPLFSIRINTATEIDTVGITNLQNTEAITFKVDTYTDDDIITFGGIDKIIQLNDNITDFDGKIPNFFIGINRPQINVTSTGASVIPSTITKTSTKYNKEDGITEAMGYFIAQSFTTTTAGEITEITLGIDNLYYSNQLSFPLTWYILNDNGGEPGSTVIESGVLATTSNSPVITSVSATIATATKYHLVIRSDYLTDDGGVLKRSYCSWDFDSGNPYSGGNAHTSNGVMGADPTDVTTWTAQATDDQVFSITQTPPSPSWDIDWSASYRKLYAA